MRRLAVIPARGGSKGVIKKNLQPLGGKPLIYWSIQAAQAAADLDQIVISTEDEEIAEYAEGLGVGEILWRPPELSRDDTPGVEPVMHAATAFPEYDGILVLQPTSPLRTTHDIDGILTLQSRTGADSIASVSPGTENLELYFSLNYDLSLSALMPSAWEMKRRQNSKSLHKLNGALYFLTRDWLFSHHTLVGPGSLGFEMPIERSIDVDSYQDFADAEKLIGSIVE